MHISVVFLSVGLGSESAKTKSTGILHFLVYHFIHLDSFDIVTPACSKMVGHALFLIDDFKWIG